MYASLTHLCLDVIYYDLVNFTKTKPCCYCIIIPRVESTACRPCWNVRKLCWKQDTKQTNQVWLGNVLKMAKRLLLYSFWSVSSFVQQIKKQLLSNNSPAMSHCDRYEQTQSAYRPHHIIKTALKQHYW